MVTQFRIDSEIDSRYLDQMAEIDRINFQQEPSRTEFEWVEQRPWMYTVLRFGEEVLGYGLVMPLDKVAFDALKEGKIWEREIGVKHIPELSPEGFYIASIAVAPKIKNRNQLLSGLLIGTTVGPVMRSAREVIAVPVSRAGEKMCQQLDMEALGERPELPGIGKFTPRLYSKPAGTRTALSIG